MTFQFVKENYAVTITPTLKKCIKYAEDFDEILDKLQLAGVEVIVKRFELKQDNTLHMHAACIGPQGLYYQKLQQKGWQVYVKPMYDGPGWLAYLEKTSSNDYEEEQLLQEHYLRHNNQFTYFSLDEI